MSEGTEERNDVFLECQVCFKGFNQTEGCPRLLKECLHAVCTPCLDKLLQEEGRGHLICPSCRHLTDIRGEASSFPVDHVRIKLLEFVKMKEKKAICTDCPDGNVADSRCLECSLFLCKDCKNAHKRHNMTRKHSVLNIEQVLEQPLNQFSTCHFCTKHPMHQLDLFCSTDDTLCCLLCKLQDHQGHKFETIEEALTSRQQELEFRLQATQSHVLSLRDQRQRVEKNKAAMIKNKMTMESAIQKEFSKLERMIHLRMESLLKELEHISNENLAVCDRNCQAIDDSLAKIESRQSYISQANQNSDAVEMLQIFRALKQSLASLSHPSSPGAAEQTLHVVFDPCFVLTAEKMIPQIGELEIQRGADQPSGAREYRECIQQVMLVFLDSRDKTELRTRINKKLDAVELKTDLGSKGKEEVISNTNQGAGGKTNRHPHKTDVGDREKIETDKSKKDRHYTGLVSRKKIEDMPETGKNRDKNNHTGLKPNPNHRLMETVVGADLGLKQSRYKLDFDFGSRIEFKGVSQENSGHKPRLLMAGSTTLGTMTSRVVMDSCAGYDDSNSIELRYQIPAGTATMRPGSSTQRYNEVDFIAYLPNSEEGQEVLSLLKVAWERGLTFKLDEQRRMFELQIKHKQFLDRSYGRSLGYPDDRYLQSVKQKLREMGVTGEDIRNLQQQRMY